MLRSDEGGANGVMVHGGDGATREMKGDTEGGATGDTGGPGATRA